MDQYIRISSLNDFIFCPYSIYFHNLYENYEKQLYQDTPQINGTLNHSLIDSGNYSTSKDILQWTGVLRKVWLDWKDRLLPYYQKIAYWEEVPYFRGLSWDEISALCPILLPHRNGLWSGETQAVFPRW